MSALLESHLSGLTLIGRGKVRDLYEVDDAHLLMVASDRLSAFDVVLPQPIPGKGEVLTRVSRFWFRRTAGVVPNHLADIPLEQVVPDADERADLGDRAVVVRRLRPLPVEAIVRGYLIGSGWKDYQAQGAVCGIGLPAGLRQADRLPEPIFTPSTKAEIGDHDENVSLEQVSSLIGRDLAEQVRAVSLAIYAESAEYARGRGHHHRRHQVRVRPRRGRAPAPDRRGAHPGLLALLAGRPVPARHQPAELRQAVRSRLSGDPRLGQAPARSHPSRGCHRAHRREVPGGRAATDRVAVSPKSGRRPAQRPSRLWEARLIAWHRAPRGRPVPPNLCGNL